MIDFNRSPDSSRWEAGYVASAMKTLMDGWHDHHKEDAHVVLKYALKQAGWYVTDLAEYLRPDPATDNKERV